MIVCSCTGANEEAVLLRGHRALGKCGGCGPTVRELRRGRYCMVCGVGWATQYLLGEKLCTGCALWAGAALHLNVFDVPLEPDPPTTHLCDRTSCRRC